MYDMLWHIKKNYKTHSAWINTEILKCGPERDWFAKNLAEIGPQKSRHLCMLWRIKKKSKTHSARPGASRRGSLRSENMRTRERL